MLRNGHEIITQSIMKEHLGDSKDRHVAIAPRDDRMGDLSLRTQRSGV